MSTIPGRIGTGFPATKFSVIQSVRLVHWLTMLSEFCIIVQQTADDLGYYFTIRRLSDEEKLPRGPARANVRVPFEDK